MRFWIEWALAVHRAVWFPMNWAMGLERPGMEMPVEYAPYLAGATEPTLVVLKGGLSEKAVAGKARRGPKRSRKSA